MIKLKVYGVKCETRPGIIRQSSVLKEVQVTKIKNNSTHKGQCGYYAFCPDYDNQFPEDTRGKEFNHGWCHFVKSQNKGIKIPVLKYREEKEV